MDMNESNINLNELSVFEVDKGLLEALITSLVCYIKTQPEQPCALVSVLSK